MADFANLDDTPEAFMRFRRNHRGFSPFELVTVEGKCRDALDFRFRIIVVMYRDLLRKAWDGDAASWDLETLLGMNEAVFKPAEELSRVAGIAPSPSLLRWIEGLKAIQEAGLRLQDYYPTVRAHWDWEDFSFEPASPFQEAVYNLWREKWRARVCPSCESYFVARKAGSKFCSRFCAQEAKDARNLKWWRERGPQWRKDYLRKKAEAAAGTRRRAKQRK